MSSISRRSNGKTGRPTEVLGVLASNAFPVLGVLTLDWSAASLLLLYWFELGVDAFWAVVRAVFAGRPPDIESGGLLFGPLAARQPTLPVPRTDLRVHLTTIVGLPLTIPVVGVAWLFAGAVLIGPVPELSSDSIRSVTLAAIGIFLVTGGSTVRTYFFDGEYRYHNARTAFGGLLFKIIIVFFTGLVTVVFVGTATEGPKTPITSIDPTAVGLPLLLVIIGLKFTSDYLSVYRDRLDVYFKSYDQTYGWQQPPAETDSIERVLADTPHRVRPSRWGRIFGGPLRLSYHTGTATLGVLGLVCGALFAIAGRWIIVAVMSGLSLTVVGLLLCIDQFLRYGTVEYRVSPETSALVAYDRLYEAPLWRIEAGEECDLRVERTIVDAFLGTVTITIEHADGEYILPHVSDSDSIVTVFDRRPEQSRRLILGDGLFDE